MSEEFVKEELFDIFTQEQTGARTHYKGSGLGMSIVKQLVEAMHGTIEVKSTLGEGTTFILHLPFKIDMETGTNGTEKTSMSLPESKNSICPDTEGPIQNSLQGITILLVEDNDLNMGIAEFYLEDYGAGLEWSGTL